MKFVKEKKKLKLSWIKRDMLSLFLKQEKAD
jgi:hypothetical protein